MEKTIKFKQGDQEISLLVISPTTQINKEAEKIYQQTFVENLRAQRPLMEEIDREFESRFPRAEERKIREKLIADIDVMKVALLSGKRDGQKLTKAQGRALAIEIMDRRDELTSRNRNRLNLYNLTVERIADLARTNYLIYLCILDPQTRKPYFKSYEDYLDHYDSELLLEGIKAFNDVTSNGIEIEDDPEIKWLKKYKFMNDEGRFIDDKGRLVDEEYRLINADGRYINENGEFINKFGHRVDKDGNAIIEEDPSAYSE